MAGLLAHDSGGRNDLTSSLSSLALTPGKVELGGKRVEVEEEKKKLVTEQTLTAKEETGWKKLQQDGQAIKNKSLELERKQEQYKLMTERYGSQAAKVLSLKAAIDAETAAVTKSLEEHKVAVQQEIKLKVQAQTTQVKALKDLYAQQKLTEVQKTSLTNKQVQEATQKVYKVMEERRLAAALLPLQVSEQMAKVEAQEQALENLKATLLGIKANTETEEQLKQKALAITDKAIAETNTINTLRQEQLNLLKAKTRQSDAAAVKSKRVTPDDSSGFMADWRLKARGEPGVPGATGQLGEDYLDIPEKVRIQMQFRAYEKFSKKIQSGEGGEGRDRQLHRMKVIRGSFPKELVEMDASVGFLGIGGDPFNNFKVPKYMIDGLKEAGAKGNKRVGYGSLLVDLGFSKGQANFILKKTFGEAWLKANAQNFDLKIRGRKRAKQQSPEAVAQPQPEPQAPAPAPATVEAPPLPLPASSSNTNAQAAARPQPQPPAQVQGLDGTQSGVSAAGPQSSDAAHLSRLMRAISNSQAVSPSRPVPAQPPRPAPAQHTRPAAAQPPPSALIQSLRQSQEPKWRQWP